MSSQQSPAPHNGAPSNRNPSNASTASRSISPHKRNRSPDFSREPPKGPRAYLTGPTNGTPGAPFRGQAPPGPRARVSPPPIGPRSRPSVGPLSAGSGPSPVSDSYNSGFRDRREYDDYRGRPRRDGPLPGGGLERRQSMGGPLGPAYSRRSPPPPRRSRSPPERRGAWNERERMDRYPREEFRDGHPPPPPPPLPRDGYFDRGREERHYPRDNYQNRDTRDRDYSYSQSYRPEPRETREPYINNSNNNNNNNRDFHHRPSVSGAQGLPLASPVDDPNKLAREQREREAAEYKKRRTVGPRPNDLPERKRSGHTRSPSPNAQHHASTHSPPHTASSRYGSNPSPSTSSPPPLSDRNNEKALSETNIGKTDNQTPTPISTIPQPHTTPSTFQRNITKPTTSVPILSAPAPPSVPSFRDIPLGPRGFSNSSLSRSVPTGPRGPLGQKIEKWDKDKRDGDKDSDVAIKEEPQDKDRMLIDDKLPLDEPSPVEEGEVLNSGDERSEIVDRMEIEKDDAPAEHLAPAPAEESADIKKESTKEKAAETESNLVKEEPEPKPLLQEKRLSITAETFSREQPSLSASPTTRAVPLTLPSTESSKSSTIPTQPANFVPTSPSFTTQNLPPSVPTGPRAQFSSPSSRGGGFWGGRRGGMMAPGQFGRQVPPNTFSGKREEEERRSGLWGSAGRGGANAAPSGRPNFIPPGPGSHYSRGSQPYTSPKLTNAELKSARHSSVEVGDGKASGSGSGFGSDNQQSNEVRAVSEGSSEVARSTQTRRLSQDIEMSDINTAPAPALAPPAKEQDQEPEPRVKQESPVDTKPPSTTAISGPTSSTTMPQPPLEDEDDNVTQSDITKRIQVIDTKLETLQTRLQELAALKDSKRAALLKIEQEEAAKAQAPAAEADKPTEAKPEPVAEDETMSDGVGVGKQDSLSPTLAAEFAAQTMEDKTNISRPSDSSPEPEQPSTPKDNAMVVGTSIKGDDEVEAMESGGKQPGGHEVASIDTTSLPYFRPGPQMQPLQYEFWNVEVTRHQEIQHLIRQHIEEANEATLQKELKLRNEYKMHLPDWRAHCERLEAEEKKFRKVDAEPSDAVPAESVAPATLEPPPTASLGRRRGIQAASDFISSEYDLEQLLKLSEKEEAEKAEAEAKEKYDDSREAVVPDMILNDEERHALLFQDTNDLIDDKTKIKGRFKFERPADSWTDEEKKLFRDRFAATPKQWGKIALHIPGRDYKACILHYYQTKQDTPYKELIRPAKTNRSRRGNRGRVQITAARTTRARASAMERGTPLDEEDVDSEEVPPTTRPRRAAAPIFGETADNNGDSTPSLSGKGRQNANKQAGIVVNVEDTSATPTPAEKTGKRQRAKADKEKKEKSASRSRTPNIPVPAPEKPEKTNKKQAEIVQQQELNALGTLASLSVAASPVPVPVPQVPQGIPPRGLQQEIQALPVLKPEPGKVEEDPGRLQPPFIAQNFSEPPVNIPGQVIIQSEPSTPRPIASARKPGAPAGRSRKAIAVDEDGQPVGPVTSSYWSVPETQDFPNLLRSYGTNFEAIAEHLGTKTTTMVRNNYTRGVENGKGYDKIAEEANRKLNNNEPVPPPPAPLHNLTRRRYDPTATQATRVVAPMQDSDTEMTDSPRKPVTPGQGAFSGSRPVALGPEARVPQMTPQPKFPKPGTFKDSRASSAPRSNTSPFAPSSINNPHIQDYQNVIGPRVVNVEPTGKTAASAIQIEDENPRAFSRTHSAHAQPHLMEAEFEKKDIRIDPEVELRRNQAELDRQTQEALQRGVTAGVTKGTPPSHPLGHQIIHPVHSARFSDHRTDPRIQDVYRSQKPQVQDLVAHDVREKRPSGEKLIAAPGLPGSSHLFVEERQTRTPPPPSSQLPMHNSPPVSAQTTPRTLVDSVAKPIRGPQYEPSPPRIAPQVTQNPLQQSHVLHAQQPVAPSHRRVDSASHTPPLGMPVQVQPAPSHPRVVSASRPSYPPSQPQQPTIQAQPPAPAPAAPKSSAFSINSLLNDTEPEDTSRQSKPSNDPWFGGSSTTSSSSYPAREPPLTQRPPETVSHYSSPSVQHSIPHGYGRHSPVPSEPTSGYLAPKPPSSVPVSHQPPVYPKPYPQTITPAATRTPPPRSTSHSGYPPPPQPAVAPPPVHAYREHPQHHPSSRDLREQHEYRDIRDPIRDHREIRDTRDPRDTHDHREHRDPYAAHYARQPQFSPPAYQSPYPVPQSRDPRDQPVPIHREPIERIYPDRISQQHAQHVQTQQPGGYPPPPPPQFHSQRPGEPQAPPQLGGYYDYQRQPRQMDSHERGAR